MRVTYAIVFVSDMQRSTEFYRDVLKLPLRFETSHWTEFATDGATIALHLGDGERPDGSVAEDTAPGRCRPGFSVGDLDDFHRQMQKHDVICVQEPRDTFGTRIAQYLDPDGLVFSISEERQDSRS